MSRFRLFTLLVVLFSWSAASLAEPSPRAPRARTTATQAPTSAPGEAPAVTAAPSAEDQARRARVFARFGSATVTVGDIEDAVAEQSPFQRQRYLEDRSKLRELAQRLVETRLLAEEARERHLDRETKVRDVVRESSVQLLVRRQFDERITPESVTDAEVLAYYESHMDEFSRPEMVRASHIVVATEADARALLTEVATADASRFRALARERSLDEETKLSGGDLRYFTADGRPVGGREHPVDTSIVTAAFAITEVGGTAARPVQVGNRWSVIKLTGRRPAETTPIEQARDGIRRRIWRERRQSAIDTFVAELRRAANVTTRTERLRAIHLDDAPATLGDPHQHGDAPATTMTPASSMAAPSMRP